MTGSARIALGLVVGKFAPLHCGHEYLIEEAARRCERLLILSWSNPEPERCGTAARRAWLAARFPNHEAVVLDGESLAARCASRGLPARSIVSNRDSDEAQQAFLAWVVGDLLRRAPDAMFSSEAYGPPSAALLSRVLGRTVEAVVLDPQRLRFPISASRIRGDPLAHWDSIASCARPAFVRRIAILGGESSGKTTLAAALAARFATAWTAEYGRQLWDEQGGVLSEADLLRIGFEQVRREEHDVRAARGYLFCDTSPLTTAGYALWMFGRTAPELAQLASRGYDGAVLCRPDFAFVQDGSRRGEAFRLEQHAWYRERLQSLGCPVLEVGGSVAERVAAVATWLAEARADYLRLSST